ncbi:RagB/SusD domain-containing protein [Anopheles sinensis]|uniref:RagB/SusD domain-containing protein n=1 Tax=Anopheles sinensis TaxID=74873 RepID=A0A084VJ64_ANOSI|nr:RagB/SusD domain-containing protein [Anopheles sinensis]
MAKEYKNRPFSRRLQSNQEPEEKSTEANKQWGSKKVKADCNFGALPWTPSIEPTSHENLRGRPAEIVKNPTSSSPSSPSMMIAQTSARKMLPDDE